MSSILRVKDPVTGEWQSVKAIRGTSAYEAARAGGYTGTEEEFSQILANISSSGTAGNDGFSPIIEISEIDGGHKITVIDKDGTESFTVQDGEQGPKGEAGLSGKTPVKGEDYWTAEDKSEIVEDVLSALPVWTGGSY